MTQEIPLKDQWLGQLSTLTCVVVAGAKCQPGHILADTVVLPLTLSAIEHFFIEVNHKRTGAAFAKTLWHLVALILFLMAIVSSSSPKMHAIKF